VLNTSSISVYQYFVAVLVYIVPSLIHLGKSVFLKVGVQCSKCCKDRQSLWEKANFSTLPTLNPLTDHHEIWCTWLRRGSYVSSENFDAVREGVSSPHVREIYIPSSCLHVLIRILRYFAFWQGSSDRLQPMRLHRFFTLDTSNDVVPLKEVPFGG